MIYRIENESMFAEIDSLGAQLCRVFDKKRDRDVLWRGDEKIWPGKSPLLFPIVGRVKNDAYKVKGVEYHLPMHGFARRREFAVQAEDARACFTLRYDEESLKVYPFRFELRLDYRLEGATLYTDYSVTNLDSDEILFSIGAHPGFLCANGDRLIFDENETLMRRVIDAETHTLLPGGEPCLNNEREIILHGSLFSRDAMVFEEPASAGMKLVRADGSGVHMDFGGAPCLGIWSKPLEELKYVCIEPWFGGDDPIGHNGNFEDKPYVERLGEGCEFKWTVAVEIF